MPRRSKLERCKSCGNEAQVGVVTGFYVLVSRRRKKQAMTPSKQIKGSLPTFGLCNRCLIRSAKRQGMEAEKLNTLRRLLDFACRGGSHE